MTPCLHDRKGLDRWAPCPQCGERKPVSASEVKLYRTCARKWAFRYASATPSPEETQAQKDGTELHRLLAIYLTTGVRPDPTAWMGELACAGIDSGLLPAPFTGRTEQADGLVIAGIPFVVIRDWMHAGTSVGPPIVLDHKTSSNPRRYGIWSDADRLDDPQHLLYGCLPGEDILFRWIYYPTKGRGKVVASESVIARREIRAGVERVVLPVAEKAYRLRETEIDPNSLDPNVHSCTLFQRPCEYTAICFVNHSAVHLQGLAPEESASMSSPGLFASLPPVNGTPAAPVVPTVTAPTAPFSFGFPGMQNPPATPPVQEVPPPAAPVESTPAPVLGIPSGGSDVARGALAPVAAPVSAAAVMARTFPPGYEIRVDYVQRENGGEYEGVRTARAVGRGATLEEAIANALRALPR